MRSLRVFRVLGATSLGLTAALVASCATKRDDAAAIAPAPTETVAPDASTKPTSCVDAAADIAVASVDLNGYPPYAVSGCSLVYVNTSGALVARDLTTGTESTVAAADARW